ncbi:hypothetical protein [Mameliella sediminis]|uniref:hypothetical protein n=1 Tax=Mameliella sediminis TaxID=2836866 RepID=UPI001C48D904|nr:hypothetical protein [Mameliella sediminis]MBV7396954.1 hypothetical protein [Mameliella sediminis]
MTRDDLARFRAGFAECELVMLADTSARTVLASDAAIPQGQERLDTLCDMAIALFRGDLPVEGCAIQSGPLGSRLFLQSSADPAEVICLVAGPRADLPGLLDAAQELLTRGTP